LELIKFANIISETYKIPYAYNIQVKFKNNEPYLLEINTRMSGGVHYSCMCGFNIPYEAINVILDKNVTKFDQSEKLNIMIGNMDTPIFNHAIKGGN
jgi:biotin carboxylase